MDIHALLLTDAPLVPRVAMTLAHTVWQGLAAAVLLRVGLAVARTSARVRYALACGAMAAVAVAAIVTFVQLGPTTTSARGVVSAISMPSPSEPSLTTPAPAQPADRPIGTPLIVAAWAVGVAIQAAWHGVGWVRVRRLGREAPLADARWIAALSTMASRVGVRRAVRVLGSARIDVPVVLGVLRPAIVVPLSLVTELSVDHIEAVLAHELGHVRRHDYLANLIQCAIETVLFYHPAIWWMSAVVRREREHCCDDMAAAAVDNRPVVAAALVQLEQRRGPQLAMAANGPSLAGRVRRLLALPSPSRRWTSPAGIAAVVLIVLAVSAPAVVRAVKDKDGTLAPGDLVTIRIHGLLSGDASKTDDFEAHVDADGGLPVPWIIGTVHVAGMAPSDAGHAIDKRFAEAFILKHANTALEIAGHGKSTPIASGDRVRVRILWHEAVDPPVITVAEVAGDGTMAVPSLGQVKIAGLSESQATAQLYSQYTALKFNGLLITVTRVDDPGSAATTETPSLPDAWRTPPAGAMVPATRPGNGTIHVEGNVARPGNYALDGHRITAKQIVVTAGGWPADPAHAWVTLTRLDRGRLVNVLDGLPVNEWLTNPAVADPYLVPGDVVQVTTTVPTHATTGVAVATKPSPAIVESPPVVPSKSAPLDEHAEDEQIRRLREQQTIIAREADLLEEVLATSAAGSASTAIIKSRASLETLHDRLTKIDGELAARHRYLASVDDYNRRHNGEVYVGGAVGRPGVYSITGQRTMTVSRIVISAGDVNVEAGAKGWVTVIRQADGHLTKPVDGVPFASLLDGSAADPELQVGDIIRVSPVDPAVQRNAATADLLWGQKYAPRVVRDKNNLPVNADQLQAEFRKELLERGMTKENHP